MSHHCKCHSFHIIEIRDRMGLPPEIEELTAESTCLPRTAHRATVCTTSSRRLCVDVINHGDKSARDAVIKQSVAVVRERIA